METRVRMHWPPGFARVPDEPWTREPVDPFARSYDGLQHHSWYANLDPTVQEAGSWLRDGGLLVDYSGGTGILEERLLAAWRLPGAALLNVDASAKFLRLAVEKLGRDPRCGFRLLRFLKEQGRLQTLAEAAPDVPAGSARGVVCANAVHLYPEPAAAAASWLRVLAPGGRLHVQSGNVGRPDPPPGSWRIDGTVAAAEAAARGIVRREARYAHLRPALADAARMAACDALRARYFPPIRPLAFYVGVLTEAGFRDVRVRHRLVAVRRDEWLAFLSAYHEGILPWVGGSEKLDGRAPAEAQVQERLGLLEEALAEAVPARFDAEWTYIDAVRPL